MTPDDRLEAEFEDALAPSAAQLRRIEARLERAFHAPPISLTEEWLGLLRVRPLMHGALAFGATALLWGTSPLAAVAVALLRGLRVTSAG